MSRAARPACRAALRALYACIFCVMANLPSVVRGLALQALIRRLARARTAGSKRQVQASEDNPSYPQLPRAHRPSWCRRLLLCRVQPFHFRVRDQGEVHALFVHEHLCLHPSYPTLRRGRPHSAFATASSPVHGHDRVYLQRVIAAVDVK